MATLLPLLRDSLGGQTPTCARTSVTGLYRSGKFGKRAMRKCAASPNRCSNFVSERRWSSVSAFGRWAITEWKTVSECWKPSSRKKKMDSTNWPRSRLTNADMSCKVSQSITLLFGGCAAFSMFNYLFRAGMGNLH